MAEGTAGEIGAGLFFGGVSGMIFSSFFAQGPWATGGFGLFSMIAFAIGIIMLVTAVAGKIGGAVRNYKRERDVAKREREWRE